MSDDAHPKPGVPPAKQRLLAWGLPVLAALAIGLAQGRAEPLGDDWEMIVNMDRHGFVRAILEDTEPTNMRFRPVGYASLWVERVPLGLSFDGVRWIGIAVIGLVGGLVGALCRRLGAGWSRSAAASLLFVCLPFHTEVYGWPCTRVDTLAAALGIAGLLCAYARRAAPAFVLLLAAFLTKESAYPLAVAGWFVLLGRGRPRARDLAAAAAGSVAFAVVLVLKRWTTGGFLAREWAATFPLTTRLEGYASHVVALAAHPASSAAAGWAQPLGWLFLGVLALAVIDAAVRLGRVERRERVAVRLCTALALVAVALGCLAVTGGLPARADMMGSRFWFLPAAFLVPALGLWLRTPWLVLLACVGAPLLHANLAPYREASRRVGVVLDRLAVEVPARERAVRIAELARGLFPITYFESMATFYFLRFDTEAPEDRPLLTLTPRVPADAERIAATDARWRAWMEARGRPILDLVWDAERGELREVR